MWPSRIKLDNGSGFTDNPVDHPRTASIPQRNPCSGDPSERRGYIFKALDDSQRANCVRTPWSFCRATLFGSHRSEQGISTCQCPTIIQVKRRQDGGVHIVASLSHKSHTSRLSLSATKFNLSNPPVSQRPTATVSRG